MKHEKKDLRFGLQADERERNGYFRLLAPVSNATTNLQKRFVAGQSWCLRRHMLENFSLHQVQAKRRPGVEGATGSWLCFHSQ